MGGGDTVQSITLCIASSPFFLTLVALGLYFAYKASILYSLTPARIGLIQQSLHTPPPVGAFLSHALITAAQGTS